MAEASVPVPDKPSVIFEYSGQAAEENAKILCWHGYDLGRLIDSELTLTLGYGSEFRPLSQLEKVVGGHPNFQALSEFLTSGMPYHFSEEISEEEREAKLLGILDRGSHKSATKDSAKVSELLGKDVHYGFSLPVPRRVVPSIKNASAQPLGLARQFSLQSDGSRKLKYRLTQDLSFFLDVLGLGKRRSINDRIDHSYYSEMIFGWCLSRILHFIISLWIHHPNIRIHMSKYDCSDAYRRMAHSARAAAQTISAHLDLAFIALRLTFGGAPNPAAFTLFSEMVTDLANEISQCTEWDPATLNSPAQPETPIPNRLLAAGLGPLRCCMADGGRPSPSCNRPS